MASGRMEFYAETLLGHTNVSFVLPNDVWASDRNSRHYERETRSLILLHGLMGTDTDWMCLGLAQEVATRYNVAIFMPAAGNSFYLDQGYSGGNFGQYVGEELPEYIRKTFGYCASRETTMIGGLSMGGYGAIHTALAYPERFSACIMLSSAMVIQEVAELGTRASGPMSQKMVLDVFGDSTTILESDKNPEVQYRTLKAAGQPLPRIYQACGTEDDLLEPNRDFRDFLRREGADLIYEEGPGAHEWPFWRVYIDRGLAALLGA